MSICLAIELSLLQEVDFKFMEEASDNQVAGDCFLDWDRYFCDVYCPPSLDVLHLLASVLWWDSPLQRKREREEVVTHKTRNFVPN